MRKTWKRLGDLLVDANLITEEQLERALKQKGENQKLGDVLLQHGYITEQQLIEVLEYQLGIPKVRLYSYPIEKNVVSLVSKDIAKRYTLVPYKLEGDKLFVAMADPLDFYATEDLRLQTGFQIETAIASKDDIIRTLNRVYDLDEGVQEFIEEASAEEQEERVTNDDSPVIKLVNQILQNAVQQRASDIHIDPQERHVFLRYRVDGVLRTERTLPKSMQSVITARIKIIANLNITESRVPQDGRIKTTIEYQSIDLRVSTLPTVYGEKIVMRVLDLSGTFNDLNHLGFNKLNLERFINLIERPTGIILITGPTGSGKSATLYAALNRLNSEEVNIITVEDPVEYRLEGINQVQVNTNVGMTFAKGLRSILRQDPDIVMVGEIRDQETADVAIRASLTGHLVLSTLHTNSALGTITRLMDMGVEPFLVASSLTGVVAQRLVRRICKDCAEDQAPTNREIEIFSKRGIQVETIKRGRGCGSCNMTGYKGRVALHELIEVNDEMRRVIMNNEPFSRLREIAIKNRTIFLIDDGLLKVKQGITTTEEVLRVANAD